MGWPQANQQTQFQGYPQNQIFNAPDLQFMQNAQRDFGNWGPYQPWMTNANQWVQIPEQLGPQQSALSQYFERVGNPYEQSQRQAYWEQMGGQNYGGVIPSSPNPLETAPYANMRRLSQTPWGDLNNMGISAAYGMPAWQQDSFSGQNATPGGGQVPAEQFNLANSGSTTMSDYGIPAGFSPADQITAPDSTQVPGYGDPQPQNPMQSATPEWMTPQQNSWGNNSSNPWGHSGGWGGRGWGR